MIHHRINNSLYLGIAAALVLCLLLSSCIPAQTTRIGPPRKPREAKCEIAVLPPGKSPDRPWVDIGAVMLENCQEYHVGLCKKRLINRACKLGGEIAYLPNPTPPLNEFNNINYRVLVAVYAVPLEANIPISDCSETPKDGKLDDSTSSDQMKCVE